MTQERFSKQSKPTLQNSKKLDLYLKPHTVVITCAPSGSGKSHLMGLIKTQLDCFNAIETNTLKLKYSIVSSDANRYDLLQETPDTLHKFDFQMSAVSRQAFNLLEAELINKISYPVNQHLVFLDSTGLTKEWRERIIKICKDHNYNVDLLLFNYHDRKDFHKFSHDKFVTEKGVKRLYEDVLPVLEKHLYNRVVKVERHFDLEDLNVNTLMDHDSYKELSKIHNKKVELEAAKDLYIVGDVHGCFYTMLKMLEGVFMTTISLDDLKIHPAQEALERRVIFGGDLIDKGLFSKEVLKLCLNNMQYVSWVLGNHENFVYRCHADPEGIVKGVPPHVVNDYFTSVSQYKGDPEFAALLETFVNESFPFIQTKKLIVTHAPCHTKFLGKIDKISKREQRNISLFAATTKEEVEKLLGFLVTEAERNHPFHFFGHVATEKVFRVKNKISMDSAAVCGFGLTYFRFYTGVSGKPERSNVPTEAKDLEAITFNKEPGLYTLFDEDKVDFESLEGKAKARIDWLCKNKVNYISGTMSPASQEISEDNSVVSIESLKSGLDYYKGKGVTSVLLQPKYMGSRCNIYLTTKTSDCYMVSRNGYVIKKLHKAKGAIDNFRSFFKKVKNFPKVKALYEKYPNLETIVLDGELLPWYALGKGLVTDSYNPLSSSIAAELKALQSENFTEALTVKLKELEASLANPDQHKELSKTNYRLSKTFDALLRLREEGALIDSSTKLQQLKDSVKKFEYQVELFGSPGNLDFKPFSILKLVMKDGSEVLPDYVQSFKEISDEEIVEVNLVTDYDKAFAFNAKCTKQELEGVVIKPILSDIRQISTKQIAPYLKVRNREYLRLIYGYDYLDNSKKYEKLSRKKDNRNKIKVSINEFNIGLRMLQTPYKDIAKENQKYKDLLATMIAEEAKESSLDPRL